MYFFRYLKFLLSATNQHGVHSPFVYAFVTKCIYAKKKYSNKKALNLVLKILSYFSISDIDIRHKNKALSELIEINFPKVAQTENTTAFIYFNGIDDSLLKFIAQKNVLYNDSIVYIANIYQNKKAWEALILMEKITVSIDLFYCGVLFFRREQVKEHFKIRI
tara:strand:+ start:4118 stop:4606 length:489 start_codon:yes stop_codon:yes gene_type:complete